MATRLRGGKRAKAKGAARQANPTQKVPRRRIHGRIADDLGIAIVNGQHLPGATLPNEIEASEKLHVSRTAYREAVRTLAAKGMVESRPKAGTRVSARRRWNLLDPDVLAWMFEGDPSEEFIAGLFELRKIVEPQAAALAAQRRTSAQLARMGHALEEMALYGLSTEQGRAADQAFHDEILRATGNELLMTLTSTLGAAIRWTTIFKQRRTRLPRDPLPEHRSLYAAVAEGDAERAMQATRELIELALQDIKRTAESPREPKLKSQ
jgi:DNA-binding FadR family transcriptional regulator